MAMNTQRAAYKWWLLVLMMISTAMAILDTTIINSVIPALLHDFHENLGDVEWIVTGYLLSMCVMLPTAGWLAQKWGYKRIYLVGMVSFTVGSLLCYVSQGLWELVWARVVEGFGSGIVQSLGLAVIIRHFDVRNRALALGLWGVAAAAAVSMGPYLGGVLLRSYGWNSLFAINLPVGVVNILGVVFIMAEVSDGVRARFSLLGFLLTGLFAPLLVVGLALGVSDGVGWMRGWDSPFVWCCLLGSVFCGVGFVWYNLRSSSPMIDLSIFRDRTFMLSMLVLFGLGFGFYGGNYLLPLYMEHSLGYSAVFVGSLYLPVGILQGVLAPLSGWASRYFGEWLLVVLGLGLFCVYLLMSSFYGLGTGFAFIMVSLLLRGLGLGLSFTPLNALAVRNLSHSQMTSASGINNTIKQMSGSLGIAIFTALVATGATPQSYAQSVSQSFWISTTMAVCAWLLLFLVPGSVRRAAGR